MAPRLMPTKMTAVNSQFKFVSIAGYELDRRRVRIVHGCVAAFVCVSIEHKFLYGKPKSLEARAASPTRG